MPRDLPIPFTGAMVRAVLADEKTQTRRPVKPEHLRGSVMPPDSAMERAIEYGAKSPYGAPGDRLWVREAWRVGGRHDGAAPRDLVPRGCTVLYEAGGSAANGLDGWERDDAWPAPGEAPAWVGRYRPPMFMPRWASRLTLSVEDVRVERVQAISDADVRAEGVTAESVRALWEAATKARRREAGMDAYACLLAPREGVFATVESGRPGELWRAAWCLINGAASWDADPWVWAITFRRVDDARAGRAA